MPVRPLTSRDPEQIGGYRLLGRLGEGGQGVVYLGEREPTKQVAVKLLHNRANQAGFAKEVVAARRVSEFCTARILDSGEDEGFPYIVTEYINGPSLREVVEDSGALSGPALYRLAIGTATALAAIHQAGVVHRDFKPGNVLLGPDGPRVIDFGVARSIDATVTATSTVLGTPSYTAPEQLAGEVAGPRADVFSWAATIGYAANGRPPYGQDTIPAVMNRIMTGKPDLGRLDGPLRKLVANCLDRDPGKRMDSREVLLRLLEHSESPIATAQALEQGRALASADDSSLADARTTRWTTLRLDRPLARRRPAGRAVIAGAAAVAALLAVTVGALAASENRTSANPQRPTRPTSQNTRSGTPAAVSPNATRITSIPDTPAEIATVIDQAMTARRTAAFSAEGMHSEGMDHFKATGRFQYRPGAATDYDMTVHNPEPGVEDGLPTRVLLVGNLGYLPIGGKGIPLAPATTDQGHYPLNMAVEARLTTSPYNVIALMKNASELKRSSDEGTHTYRGSAAPARLASSGPVAPLYQGFEGRQTRATFTLVVTHDFLPKRLDIDIRG